MWFLLFSGWCQDPPLKSSRPRRWFNHDATPARAVFIELPFVRHTGTGWKGDFFLQTLWLQSETG